MGSRELLPQHFRESLVEGKKGTPYYSGPVPSVSKQKFQVLEQIHNLCQSVIYTSITFICLIYYKRGFRPS